MESDDPDRQPVPATVELLVLTAPSLTRQGDVATALDQKALGMLAASGAIIAVAGPDVRGLTGPRRFA